MKGKFHPRTGHEGPEGEYRYSCTLFLTSALDGVGGQRHAPAALPPEKTRYPLYRRLGGPQGRSGQVRKISPPSTEVPRVKRRQKEADHSQPRSADVKKERIYFQTSTTRKLGSASNRAFAGFQASAVRPMRSALFCEITTI